MGWKRKVSGGLLAVVGFMLSPLSWWNDLVINLPLAIGFGWIVSLFYKPAFEASVVVGYWLTNVLGFVLLHKGAEKISSDKQKRYSRSDFIKDVSVSLVYTGVIVALFKFGILKPIKSYFEQK